MRMSAAQRLDDLYARVERQQELEAAQQERRERARDADHEQDRRTAAQKRPDTDGPLEDDERIQDVFANILRRDVNETT